MPVATELQEAITSRTYLPFDEARQAAYITSSAAVIAKLRAYENCESTRHLDDIASIIRLRGKKLDHQQINIVAARLGLLGRWRDLWRENHPPFSR